MNILRMAASVDENFTLALCTPGDEEELSKIESICFENDPWSCKMFSDALENPSCRIYALFDMQMSKIIAYGVLYLCFDECDLANIAVIPERRGQGIGGKFLDMILEEAREYGALRTFLEVRESNGSARGLYLSRGFFEIGIRRKYYRDPCEDAVLMMKGETE